MSRANRARGPDPTTPAWAGTRTARQLRHHDTRVRTTRALRGATPDTTTLAFPLREPFGARRPPTPVNGDDDARHRRKTSLQTSDSIFMWQTLKTNVGIP